MAEVLHINTELLSEERYKAPQDLQARGTEVSSGRARAQQDHEEEKSITLILLIIKLIMNMQPASIV
jgi:hypothetical protein